MRTWVQAGLTLLIALILALLPRPASATTAGQALRGEFPDTPGKPLTPAERAEAVRAFRAYRQAQAELARGSSLAATAPSTHVPVALRYTVQSGDTLWQISMHYGVATGVIMQANGLTANSFISPGMELIIPMSNEEGTARQGPDDPIVTGQGLHLVASIARQKCWLFEGSAVLGRWTCSTGRPDSPSIVGNYTVQTKLDRAYFAGAESWMPYWLGIYDAQPYENGVHGLPYAADTGEKFWTDKIGVPVTFGCIMFEDAVAKQIFDMAYVGMPVTILP